MAIRTASELDASAPVGPEAAFPDFPEMTPTHADSAKSSLDHLLDVKVTVTAELGRVQIPLANILKLGVGSVIDLNRVLSEPVDLVVQGMPIARGEVIVVDERFALRILEILDPKLALRR